MHLPSKCKLVHYVKVLEKRMTNLYRCLLSRKYATKLSINY